MAKKFYEKATVGDWIFSILLPFWGIVIGVLAVAFRKEKRRGITMISIGLVLLALLAVRIALAS